MVHWLSWLAWCSWIDDVQGIMVPCCSCLQVEVQLVDSGLVHHHTGGPSAALQPLCLQLWCGKLLLSSTHTLLHLATSSSSSSNPGEHSAAFGWWGITAPKAAAVAAELHHEVQVVAAHEGDPAAAE